MIFLRHPVTEAMPDLCYGRLDLGLGEGAEQQIEAALEAVPRVPAIRTSPLRRARLLADRFAARDGADLVEDPRLQEYDFGAWEGRLWPEIPRTETEPWIADMLERPAPGGESFADLIARVSEALEDFEEGMLIVCHAGPIRAARMLLTGASFSEVFDWKVPFCQPLRFDKEVA